MKREIWLKDLTVNRFFPVVLPMSPEELEKELKTDHEYVITDGDLDLVEYDSIQKVNEVLLYCQEEEIPETELEMLFHMYSLEDVQELVENRCYVFVDFDAETETWNYGNGGDFTSDYDKGMLLYDLGLTDPFETELPPELHDWIQWDSVWTTAETVGWQEVIHKGTHYLFHS